LAGVDPKLIQLRGPGGAVIAWSRVEIAWDLVFKPEAPLAAWTTYTVDIALPALKFQYAFTTGESMDNRAPQLVSVSPDPESAADPCGPFQFHFDEPLLTWRVFD